MEQIIESERYACVRTGDVEEKMESCDWKTGCRRIKEKRTLRFKDEAVSVFYYM